MFSFHKSEKLRSKKIMDELFAHGNCFYFEPFKVYWMFSGEIEAKAQVLINASKKKIKRAVDRNKMKRLIREAYRLNKQPFYNSLDIQNKKCVMAILYTSKRLSDYKLIENKIILILQRLQKEFNTKE
ncbi:MAG: ribonuclease P [Bacteroidetes bacterium ADurb.Bin408]|nr:MAG: ribonuclease P [Bacteroidetes bacterium ADurb.Bin408]